MSTSSEAKGGSKRKRFNVGGTIRVNSSDIYVRRNADNELLKHCLEGNFCYVLTARQMGKSSLMVRAHEALRAQHGFNSVILDMSGIGIGSSLDDFYYTLLDLMLEQLELDLQLDRWWRSEKNARLVPAERFKRYLAKELLPTISTQLIVFVDEVDRLRNSAGFAVDDFFVQIRAIFNARAIDSILNNVSFVLIGFAHPSELIRDQKLTPFNIGERIQLDCFTSGEAAQFAEGIGLPPTDARQAVEMVFYWTGGHPYLSQRLCQAIAKEPDLGTTPDKVEKLVHKLLLNRENPDDNIVFVERELLNPTRGSELLVAYYEIYSGRAVDHDDERAEARDHLKLCGVIKLDNGRWAVSNQIYWEYFNKEWVDDSFRTYYNYPLQIVEARLAERDATRHQTEKHSGLHAPLTMQPSSVIEDAKAVPDVPTNEESWTVAEIEEGAAYFTLTRDDDNEGQIGADSPGLSDAAIPPKSEASGANDKIESTKFQSLFEDLWLQAFERNLDRVNPTSPAIKHRRSSAVPAGKDKAIRPTRKGGRIDHDPVHRKVPTRTDLIRALRHFLWHQRPTRASFVLTDAVFLPPLGIAVSATFNQTISPEIPFVATWLTFIVASVPVSILFWRPILQTDHLKTIRQMFLSFGFLLFALLTLLLSSYLLPPTMLLVAAPGIAIIGLLVMAIFAHLISSGPALVSLVVEVLPFLVMSLITAGTLVISLGYEATLLLTIVILLVASSIALAGIIKRYQKGSLLALLVTVMAMAVLVGQNAVVTVALTPNIMSLIAIEALSLLVGLLGVFLVTVAVIVGEARYADVSHYTRVGATGLLAVAIGCIALSTQVGITLIFDLISAILLIGMPVTLTSVLIRFARQ